MAKKKKAKTKKLKRQYTAALICPKCTLFWASLKYRYESRVNAGDITAHVGPQPKNGDELVCPGCEHKCTNADVWLAIAAKPTDLKPGDRAVKEVASEPAENGEELSEQTVAESGRDAPDAGAEGRSRP